MKKTIYLFSIIILSALHGYSTKQVVQVANFSFTPSNFTINLGDTIQWVLASGSHTTTSLAIPAGAVAWNAPINSSALSFIYVPAVTGTYNYRCNIHLSMQGIFTVAGCPAVSGQISATGATSVCKPLSVTLNCFASAGASFQWQKNSVNITVGGNSSSYIATATGSYRVILSNICGSTFTTNAITATVVALPAAIITNGDTVFKCTADTVALNATTTGTVSYQWSKNGVNIVGATAGIYKTKAAGSYKVTVTKTASGCSKTSKATKVINNCREQNNLSTNIEFELYPNPASQQINISFESDDIAASFKIVNITGQVLLQKEMQLSNSDFEKTIDISNLPPGVYTVLVQTASGTANQLFIKE